ncbi:potassium channel family protein [Patescibacteria group bacterium]|nr:potassium channel family protein [Patescibacteria group bacterium]
MPKKQLKESIKLIIITITALLSLGTVVFSVLEGWNLVDSFYFVAMTATTVGYGDLVPTHTLSKIITVFYSLMIIPIILYGFSILAKYEVERVYRKVSGIERQQQEQEEELEKTERKIQEQKRLMKEQQEALEKQEAQLRKQTKISKEHEEELEGHQRKIKKQEKEIREQEEELEVVEDVVKETMIKKL